MDRRSPHRLDDFRDKTLSKKLSERGEEEEVKFRDFQDPSMCIDEITLTSGKVRSTSEMKNTRKNVFNSFSSKDSTGESKRKMYKRNSNRSMEATPIEDRDYIEFNPRCRSSQRAQDTFIKISLLGQGSFGTVYRVFKKLNQTEYALKLVNGSFLRRLNKIHEVHVEKHILMKCKHQNIVRFYQSFKENQFYYFLLELCENGSLEDYLRKRKTCNLEVTKYFAAQIINGLEYLHKQGIVHRDLKPANICINEEYVLKLTDFGTAKIMNCTDERILKMMEERESQENSAIQSERKRGTFVGTHEYISPEVLNSYDASPLVDIWGLGVIVYELLHGFTPFRGATEMLTYQNITAGNPKVKADVDEEAKEFILSCLKVDAKDRLGYCQENVDYQKIKSHKFFEGIDFESLDPYSVDGLIYSKRKKNSQSCSEMKNERMMKMNHLRMKTPCLKSEAYSTMDSSTHPKCIISLRDLSRERHFHRQGDPEIPRIPHQEEYEIPVYFDEAAYLGKSTSSVISNLEDDVDIKYQEEEEKIPPSLQDLYNPEKQSRYLKDIQEEPEEYQYLEGSSSLNSLYFRRLGSNEDFKSPSDLTKFSKDNESGTSFYSGQKNSQWIKSSKVEKKGWLFFNERVLTLTSSPRLFYMSHSAEKEIDLNPTTVVKQVSTTKFEITNYYPTTKYLFRAKNERECGEWVVAIKKVIQQIFSE